MKTIFVLIILLLVLTSCSKLESAGYELGKQIGSGELIDSSDDGGNDIFCYDKAIKLMPDTVQLVFVNNAWHLKEFSFLDDYSDSSVSIRYKEGSAQGENVNHFYPSNLIENEYVTYEEALVDDQGLIRGDFTFKASFTLEKTSDLPIQLNDSKYGKNIVEQSFKIVEIEYDSCNLPI